MKSFLFSLCFLFWACAAAPPKVQPPNKPGKHFELSSDNIIRTIKAGEKAEYSFQIAYLTKKKSPVRFKILNQPRGLQVQLDKSSATDNQKIKLIVQAPKSALEAKHKLLIEARGGAQITTYPFILNILPQQNATPKIVMDFVTKEFNPRGKANAIVGSVFPPRAQKIALVISSPAGTKKRETVNTQNDGSFVLPFDNFDFGVYKVLVALPNKTVLNGTVIVSPTNSVPRLSLRINNPRKLKIGDNLVISGNLQPAIAGVPITLEVIVPAQPAPIRRLDTTDVKGNVQSVHPIGVLGIHQISARYSLQPNGPQFQLSPTLPSPGVLQQGMGDAQFKAPTPLQFASSGANMSYYSTHSAVAPMFDAPTECCTISAHVGEGTRPGIFVFIVGGATCDGGNPNFLTQSSIANDVYRTLTNDLDAVTYRQFLASDIIYFNPNAGDQDVNCDGVNDIERRGSAPEYNKTFITTQANAAIRLKSSGLTTNIPLYVVMLGKGGDRDNRYFWINGTDEEWEARRRSLSPEKYMTADAVRDMLTGFVDSGGSGSDRRPKINRIFLLMSFDYGGTFGSISTGLGGTPCITVTSTNETRDIYPVRGGYEQSFAWQFFNYAFTASRPSIGETCSDIEGFVDENAFLSDYGLQNSYTDVVNYIAAREREISGIFHDGDYLMAPTWKPVGSLFPPIGYSIACTTGESSRTSSESSR